jgi:hypothetical protein
MTVFTYSRNSGNKKNGCVRVTKNSGKSCRPAERILQYKGLITGAILPHKKIIALSGYSKMPYLFFYTITTTAISFPAIRKD